MPITDADGDVYTLTGVEADLYTRILTATLRVQSNGLHEEPAALTVLIEGDDFDALLDDAPAGLSRREDFTTAIYNHCVATVLPAGTIS